MSKRDPEQDRKALEDNYAFLLDMGGLQGEKRAAALAMLRASEAPFSHPPLEPARDDDVVGALLEVFETACELVDLPPYTRNRSRRRRLLRELTARVNAIRAPFRGAPAPRGFGAVVERGRSFVDRMFARLGGEKAAREDRAARSAGMDPRGPIG